jgi:hypothetical protein
LPQAMLGSKRETILKCLFEALKGHSATLRLNP